MNTDKIVRLRFLLQRGRIKQVAKELEVDLRELRDVPKDLLTDYLDTLLSLKQEDQDFKVSGIIVICTTILYMALMNAWLI